jgi:hypothetical protein
VPRARAKPRQPFTRLGGVGLGSRVRPEIAANTAIAGRRRWTMLRRGSPRGDEASEVRWRIRGRSRQRSGAVGRFAEVSRFGVNRGLSHRVGTSMRRVPRRRAIVFENNIRELQTSVGRTGVAAGPHPRVPGSPSQRAGRPDRGGNLARRDLHPSDVGRRAHRNDRVGKTRSTSKSTKDLERGPGPQGPRRVGSEAGSTSQRGSCKRNHCELARARREIDTIEDVRAATTRSRLLHRRSGEPQRSTVMRRPRRPLHRERPHRKRSGRKRGRRASSRRGSGARQRHCDEGVRGRKRRQDAGWGHVLPDKPSLAPHRARFGGDDADHLRRGRLKSGGKPSADLRMPAGVGGESSRKANVW